MNFVRYAHLTFPIRGNPFSQCKANSVMIVSSLIKISFKSHSSQSTGSLYFFCLSLPFSPHDLFSSRLLSSGLTFCLVCRCRAGGGSSRNRRTNISSGGGMEEHMLPCACGHGSVVGDLHQTRIRFMASESLLSPDT